MLLDAGLSELVAESEAQYLELAKRLATDRQFREAMTQKISSLMQGRPTFHDLPAFIRKLQPVYEEIYASMFP